MKNIPSKDEWAEMINQDSYNIEAAISNSEQILKAKYAKYTDDKAFLKVVCMNTLLLLFL